MEPKHPFATDGDERANVSLHGDGGHELEPESVQYRALVEHLPLVSYIERAGEQSASYVSPQIFDLVGYTPKEWTSSPAFFAGVLHPADRARVLEGFAAMHATGEPFSCEYRLIARNGTLVWIHDAAVVVLDEDGGPNTAQGYMIDISERKRAEATLVANRAQLRLQTERVAYMGLHDLVTGLPNRTLFQDRTRKALQAVVRNGTGFAVILLELDHFHELIETLGYPVAEGFLVEVAARLRGALREVDTVARLGGHQFAVLAPGASDPAAALAIAEKLRLELVRPAVLRGMAHETEASIGVALCPEDGLDVETLIRHADVAVGVSKNTHSPTLYSEKFDNRSLARMELRSELRTAIVRHELVVDYQPEIDVGSGKMCKVEALVRWQHPTHGLLDPDRFIPLAEQTGLIRVVTRHVLDTALGQCCAWREVGNELTVAVNITARELADLRFPDEVADLLAKWRIAARYLELEITERTIVTDLPRSRSILARLSELGVRLAIDDFGSGQTPLAYLRGLPLNVLKIDKSIVKRMVGEPEDAALVRMAIELGHNLGLEVVAEGVENEAAARCLEVMGCDTMQGYFAGRPQNASGIANMLRRHRTRASLPSRPIQLAAQHAE